MKILTTDKKESRFILPSTNQLVRISNKITNLYSLASCRTIAVGKGFNYLKKMALPVTFILQPDEKNSQLKDVFRTDINFQVLDTTLHEYQGTESSVLKLKCKDALSSGIPCPIVTDVTSVCFNALGGLPGILITSFVEKLTSFELYRIVKAWDDKSAYVMYSLGLLEDKDSEIQIFQDVLHGNVVKPENQKARGWEACFLPDGYTKPYADLSKEDQVEISERRKALRSLKTYLISKEFFC